MDSQPLQLRESGERVELASPGVGLFSGALARGEVLTAGQTAGVLTTLGRSVRLFVPDGVRGVIATDPPSRTREPVDFGRVLYALEPLGAGDVVAPVAAAAQSAHGLVLPSPSSGRFYHRPSPSEPPFAKPGDVLEPNRPVGLIEVMKTFGHVPYRAAGGLPKRAKLVRYLVDEGAEVRDGEPLIEVEPA
jgi:biotin carboxyl carrier protein